MSSQLHSLLQGCLELRLVETLTCEGTRCWVVNGLTMASLLSHTSPPTFTSGFELEQFVCLLQPRRSGFGLPWPTMLPQVLLQKGRDLSQPSHREQHPRWRQMG
jgi:hypothetical protein